MSGGKPLTHLTALLALFASYCVMAQDSTEEDELNQFLDLLNQQTSIATKTRLNADFVPGMLSVLDAEQMQRRGFKTLWDALESLPWGAGQQGLLPVNAASVCVACGPVV